MTVNELLEQLQQARERGDGECEVVVALEELLLDVVDCGVLALDYPPDATAFRIDVAPSASEDRDRPYRISQ